MSCGEVAEWFIAAVLKTAVAKVTGSSNLPLSAINLGAVSANLGPR
jgi:hypothetical protein